MSAPNPRAMRRADSCDSPLARADEAEAPLGNAISPNETPQESAAPSDRRRSSHVSHYDLLALAWIEEKLQAAQRENDCLKTRNQSLAQELAAASQRGTEAHHLAHHDGLTGLPNRLLLMQRLQNGISEACQSQSQLALLFIDLDRFKFVNDRLGHTVGDKLLTIVATRLLAAIRTGDIACRYGGDEFVVLLSDIGDASVVGVIAEKVRTRIEGCYGIDGNDIHIRASIGFALYPAHGEHCDALLKHADASMYQSKAERSSRRDHVPVSSLAPLDRLPDDSVGDTARKESDARANRRAPRSSLPASQASARAKV